MVVACRSTILPSKLYGLLEVFDLTNVDRKKLVNE